MLIEPKNQISIKPAGSREWIGFAAFISLALLTAASAILPRLPSAVSAEAPLTEFSSERALKHVMQIAQNPHPIGSAEHTRVRAYIIEELKRLGLDQETQSAIAFSPMRGNSLSAATVNNVIGTLRGIDSGKAVALVAHYDSVSTGPGAGDNGAGVAAILEIVRALKSGERLKNDVIALFTDGEETGLFGARAFVKEHPSAKKIGAVINFDARGTRGPSLLFETSGDNGALIEEFSRVCASPLASSLFYEIYKRLPNDTDFSVFKRAGFAGFNFAYIDGSDRYHAMSDTVENLDSRSLQHQGSYGLALSRRLGGLNLDEVRKRDAVYFDILGLTLEWGAFFEN